MYKENSLSKSFLHLSKVALSGAALYEILDFKKKFVSILVFCNIPTSTKLLKAILILIFKSSLDLAYLAADCIKDNTFIVLFGLFNILFTSKLGSNALAIWINPSTASTLAESLSSLNPGKAINL